MIFMQKRPENRGPGRGLHRGWASMPIRQQMWGKWSFFASLCASLRVEALKSEKEEWAQNVEEERGESGMCQFQFSLPTVSLFGLI